MTSELRVRVIGPGRAGWSLTLALRSLGWTIEDPLNRHGPIETATDDMDAVVVAIPDASIGEVAERIACNDDCAVLHLSGASALDVLAPHGRRGSLHPLVALPSREVGARRLVSGAWFAIAGDEIARALAEALGGRTFEVPEEQRVVYHAAAVVAANHLVALMGQVERIAGVAGLDLAPFLELARGSLGDVEQVGPRAALTGPAARGDDDTIERHLAAIDEAERNAYRAMADQARRLVR